MKLSSARRGLVVIWIAGAGLLFVLLLVQSFAGRYGDGIDEAWGWFLASIGPTIGLMIAVTTASFPPSHAQEKTSGWSFSLAIFFSLSYLAVLLVTVLAQPFSTYSQLELFARSHLWLGPIQGFTDAALGVFFTRPR